MISNKFSIWTESATTTRYISPAFNFTQSRRFQKDSIYWPPKYQKSVSVVGLKNLWDQEIKALSKKIDEQQKLQKLNDGRQPPKRWSVMKTSSQQIQYNKKLSILMKSNGSTVSSFNNTVAGRLYKKMPKGRINTKRDRRGLRSDQIINGEQQQTPLVLSNYLASKKKSKQIIPKRGFSASKRIDLSRPDNFNPGPGSYKIIRYLQQQNNPRYSPLKKYESQQLTKGGNEVKRKSISGKLSNIISDKISIRLHSQRQSRTTVTQK